jgi:hypothetical protein
LYLQDDIRVAERRGLIRRNGGARGNKGFIGNGGGFTGARFDHNIEPETNQFFDRIR